MHQVTVSGDSNDINFILFVCDILQDDEVYNGSESLSYLMDRLLDYLGREPLEMASYGLESIENFRPAFEKMRRLVETFDKAVEIPKEQIRAERQRRRQRVIE